MLSRTEKLLLFSCRGMSWLMGRFGLIRLILLVSWQREGNRKGPTISSSEQEGPKTPDPKTLRRLAQNREAARKSRLRKKNIESLEAQLANALSDRSKATETISSMQDNQITGPWIAQGVLLVGKKVE